MARIIKDLAFIENSNIYRIYKFLTSRISRLIAKRRREVSGNANSKK